MDETLKKLVEKAIQIAEKTGEFVIEQAPLLLQEFYRWHIVKNIFIMITMVVVAITIWNVFKSIGAKEKPKSLYSDYIKIAQKYYEETLGAILCVFLLGGGIGGCITAFCISAYNLVFILSAPKLYLIEYFLK